MARIALIVLVVMNIMMLSGCATFAPAPATDFSPLYLAVVGNNIIEVRRLIDEGVDINAKNQSDFTALHGAAVVGRTEIGKLLIEKGADVNRVAIDASTPLMWAVHYGKTDFVRLLIANGANISMRNVLGKTALDIAIDTNRTELHNIILEAVNRKNSPQQFGRALQQKIAEPSQQNNTELKKLVSRKNKKGLSAYLDKHPEALSDIEDPHLRLLYTGPAKLRIIDIAKLVKNKKKDAIIIAKIKSTSGLYKDFNDDELAELKKMHISDKVVTAMIAATAEYNKEEKSFAEQPLSQASQIPVQSVQEVPQQAVPQQQVAQESDSAAECFKLAVALKGCDRAGGFFSFGCKAIARSQFNCPNM